MVTGYFVRKLGDAVATAVVQRHIRYYRHEEHEAKQLKLLKVLESPAQWAGNFIHVFREHAHSAGVFWPRQQNDRWG